MKQLISIVTAILTMSVSALAQAQTTNTYPMNFETSISNQFAKTIFTYRFFTSGLAYNQLSNRTFEVMDQPIAVRALRFSNGQINLSMEKNLNLKIASESQGNILYGGSGEVYLTTFKLDAQLRPSALNMAFAKYTTGSGAVVPSLHIESADNTFRVIQNGYVKIKKHVLFVSWTEYKNFSGTFDGLTWTGDFHLKEVDRVINGNDLATIDLNALRSVARLSRRTFSGSGIPATEFLARYGDNLQYKISSIFITPFDDVPTFSSGESESTVGPYTVERRLASYSTYNQTEGSAEEMQVEHLDLRHAVSIEPNENFLANSCASELVAPSYPVNYATLAVLDHDLLYNTLNTAVPLSYFARALYLAGRLGRLCLPGLSDSMGGTIQYIPNGVVAVSPVPTDPSTIRVRLNYRFEHSNPLLPNGRVTGQVYVDRYAKVTSAYDEFGRTNTLNYTGTSDVVTSSSDVRYINALKAVFASKPFLMAIPIPSGVGPYVPRVYSTSHYGQNLVIKSAMHLPWGETVTPIPLASIKIMFSCFSHNDNTDQGRWTCQSNFQCPAGTGVKNVRVACQTECMPGGAGCSVVPSEATKLSFLNTRSPAWNTFSATGGEDFGHDRNFCSVGSLIQRTPVTGAPLIVPRSGFSYGCSDYDENGGECGIVGEAICEEL